MYVATAKFLFSLSLSDIGHGPRGRGTFHCYNFKITKINEVFVIINYISIIITIVIIIINSEALFGGV